MAVYNAESALARLVAPHYRRADDEARTLLGEAFSSPADLELIGDALHVRINQLFGAPAEPGHRRALRSAQRHGDQLPQHDAPARLLRQGLLSRVVVGTWSPHKL